MTQPSLIHRGEAEFSPCRRYRYTLTRWWGSSAPCVFLMLNPSTATEVVNDPTITRCMGFAKRWGFGALVILNLFAWRSTDPRQLYRVEDPIGPENDLHIARVAREAGAIVCAWGTHGRLLDRDRRVAELLASIENKPAIECLGLTKGGDPKHPLYLLNDTARRLFEVRHG